ncbi:MAG TPA: phosphotransferase, partial [Streptosporangiaceae bacterium]
MVEWIDPLMSPPPALPPETLRDILRGGYGIEGALTPLAGERDQNFRVEPADGRRFLLKVSNPIDDRSVIEMQTAALRHIAQCDPALPVMQTLPTPGGNPWIEVPGADGRTYPVRLFTFLPGQVVKPTALTSQAIWSFGEVTAR